jgi:hypothetical protein
MGLEEERATSTDDGGSVTAFVLVVVVVVVGNDSSFEWTRGEQDISAPGFDDRLDNFVVGGGGTIRRMTLLLSSAKEPILFAASPVFRSSR